MQIFSTRKKTKHLNKQELSRWCSIQTVAIMLLLSSTMATAQDAKKKSFIDALMMKMTVDEKIGQLNLPASLTAISG